MKFEGFKLSGIHLETTDQSFDLHNCFDFVGFDYDIASRALSLRWKPSSYASANEQCSLTVAFRNVIHFSATPRESAIPFTEDDCLDFIGFVQPDPLTEHNLQIASPPTPNEHYVFNFMSGLSLRVYAEVVECQIRSI